MTTNSMSQKKTRRRGSSFTRSKDTAVATAWIAISENPIARTEQNENAFFKSVRSIYNDTIQPANKEIRTMKSIKTRCKTIHKECMRFAGRHAGIMRSYPTSIFMEDIVNMATALYNGMKINGLQNECGKPFRFIQSWRILRKHEKYMGGGEVSKEGNTAAIAANVYSKRSGARHRRKYRSPYS